MAYTTIDDPSAHFQTVLWSGDNSDSRNITNDGNSDLQPDWVWIKSRNGSGNGYSHNWWDTSRGVSSSINTGLFSDQTDSEGGGDNVTTTAQLGGVSAMLSDGFTVKEGNTDDARYVNKSSNTYVAWQWKANGGTTSSNSSGTNITSTVQANTTAGFSIVTFTGTGNDGDSYGHGLTSAPELVIPKKRSGTSNWQGYAFDGGNSQYWYLNLNNAFASTSGNSAASSSSVITTDGSGDSNPSGGTVVSYCFHSVQGYSKIGRYKGNGDTDGPFVYTGFKPAWIIFKSTSATGHWQIYDNTRETFNDGTQPALKASGNDAEFTKNVDILSNGVKLRDTTSDANADGVTYLYMAFAEHPFVSSKGVPVTAR